MSLANMWVLQLDNQLPLVSKPSAKQAMLPGTLTLRKENLKPHLFSDLHGGTCLIPGIT